MSLQYQLARITATQATLPEFQDRLRAVGARFETSREAAGHLLTDHPAGPIATAASVFERAYSTAAQALEQAEDRGRQLRPNEAVAIDSLLARVEQSEAAYRALTSPAPGPMAVRVSDWRGPGLLMGALLLGAVLWLSRVPEDNL